MLTKIVVCRGHFKNDGKPCLGYLYFHRIFGEYEIMVEDGHGFWLQCYLDNDMRTVRGRIRGKTDMTPRRLNGQRYTSHICDRYITFTSPDNPLYKLVFPLMQT